MPKRQGRPGSGVHLGQSQVLLAQHGRANPGANACAKQRLSVARPVSSLAAPRAALNDRVAAR
eukprot:6824596-Lingulodinium_polyedra.AAC.1